MNEMMSKMIQQSVESLVKATQELGEKAQWSPLDKGRSAANQVAECALICDAVATTIAREAFPEVNWEQFGAAVGALGKDTERAIAALQESTEKLSATLIASSPEKLSVSIPTPFGSGDKSLGEIAMIATGIIPTMKAGQLYPNTYSRVSKKQCEETKRSRGRLRPRLRI